MTTPLVQVSKIDNRDINPRVVIDTNVLLGILHWHSQEMAWLQSAWEQRQIYPLTRADLQDEFVRVCQYPAVGRTREDGENLLRPYLIYCEWVSSGGYQTLLPRCRDPKDQMFLEVAQDGSASYLITQDKDLLRMRKRVPFRIVSADQAKILLHRPSQP